jgi:hypothetical protein
MAGVAFRMTGWSQTKAMAHDNELNRRVGELFGKHFQSDRSVDDIKALHAVLPDDPAALRGLASRCNQEGQKALRAGHHTESRRFEVMGRQLRQHADGIERRG